MRRLALILPLLVLTQCVRPSQPPPAPPPAPRPVQAPPPVAPVTPVGDWLTWPLTPGDWRYGRDGRGPVASYGTALTLRCEGGRMLLTRTGAAPATTALTIRTSSTVRALPAMTSAGTATAAVTARDPILDAMGFSRGRFTVESAGAPPLVVPAWAEVLRVTEDCRG